MPIPTRSNLALCGIDHRRTTAHSPKTNGFVEHFQRTAKEESFAIALCETFYPTVEALQADFDRWQVHYNTERPHLSYRNRGKRPLDTVNAYLSVRDKAS